MQDIKQFVIDAINALPDTADGIAQFFELTGIKGIPRDSEYCPVANYLKRAVPSNTFVSVGSGWVDVHQFGAGDFYTVPLPDHVAEFIANHDDGKYPNLRPVAPAFDDDELP